MSQSWHVRVAAASVVAVLATGGVASADPSNNNSEKLRAAVSAAGILEPRARSAESRAHPGATAWRALRAMTHPRSTSPSGRRPPG
jgi:hypothetical protein